MHQALDTVEIELLEYKGDDYYFHEGVWWVVTDMEDNRLQGMVVERPWVLH